MSDASRIMETRVSAILKAENVEHPAFADLDDLVDSLRRVHREYQRRKVAAMKVQVGQVLERLVKRAGDVPGVDCVDSGEAAGGREEEGGEVGMCGNGMNASLTGMYANAGGGSLMRDDSADDDKTERATTATGAAETAAGVAPTSVPAAAPTSVQAAAAAATAQTQPKRRKTNNQKSSKHAPSSLRSSCASTPLPVTYADLGGIDDVLADVKELVEYPLTHPEVYAFLGVSPPRGVLLHGPPGCGKTALANAIANECRVPFLRISAPEVVSGMSGESEAKVRGLFREAAQKAPCILFIDEIDAIATKRDGSQRGMEQRIVAQMLTCMDDLNGLACGEGEGEGEGKGEGDVPTTSRRHVVVIGATNRPDALDSALRRAGRFDREISMGIPSERSREMILKKMSGKLRLSGDFSFAEVAKRTPGFVGADLAALIKEAAALAVRRIFASIDVEGDGEGRGVVEAGSARALLSHEHMVERNLAITAGDFAAAISKVQPSVRREGFATTPDVTWSDVGSLGDVRDELSFAISRPIANPQLFEAMGLKVSVGVLLFGPPGCGKTLVAKAVANDSGANFISIKGPELLNKYVGESERAVRQVFSRARAAAPCVLFFDELDALAPRRGSDTSSGPAERVVNQLLTEMDGVDGRQGVFLMAATNRPDIIDPALLRPGRLEKILYVPLPAPEGRASILEALTRSTPLGADVDLNEIAGLDQLTGFSGADLASLVREASVMALKERMMHGETEMTDASEPVPPGGISVTRRHFMLSVPRVQPSVSRKDQRMYDSLRLKLRSSRGHLRGAGAKSGDQQEGGIEGADDVQTGGEEPMVS